MSEPLDLSGVDFEPIDLTSGSPSNESWRDTLIRLRFAVAIMGKTRAEMIEIARDDQEVVFDLIDGLHSESEWLEGVSMTMRSAAIRIAAALYLASEPEDSKCSAN